MSDKEGCERAENATAKHSTESRPSHKQLDERSSVSDTKPTGSESGKDRRAVSGSSDREPNRNRNNSQYDRSGYRSSDRGSDKDRGSRGGRAGRGGGDGGGRDKGSSSSRGGRVSSGGSNREKEHTPRKPDQKERKDERGEKGDNKDTRSHKKTLAPKELKPSQMKSAADLEAQLQKEEEAKKQKEEEEERIRLEEIRKKEAEQKRIEEEAELLREQELKSIQEYIGECQERIDSKKNLRQQNLAAADQRPDDSFIRTLSSVVKKNTAFVKKLKNLTESQKDSVTKEFEGLNLTKYVGEAAASITEAKLKMSDIPCAVHVSSILFQRYQEFPTALLENIQKCLLVRKEDKINNPSKYRVDLRFFAELVSVGLFSKKEGLAVVGKQLEQLVNSDLEEHHNLAILSSFCKHCGDDYMALVPRKYRLLADKYELEIPMSQMLQREKQKACRNLMKDYFLSLCKHLIRVYKDLKNIERHNHRTLQTKGELSNERKESYENALTTYQKLHMNTSVLADFLDDDMPDLPPEDLMKDDECGFDVFDPSKNAEFQYVGDSTLFEDEDARGFYESLPDLRAFIPGICYKESEQSGVKADTKDMETGLEEDMENLKVEDVEREMETEQQIAEVESKEEAKVKGQEEPAVEEDYSALHYLDVEDEADTGNLMKVQFDAYLQSLPNCVNRDLLDKASIEFCMNFNIKSNRKKLVKALFTVHRTRYDLLPFYARMVATLYPCMPDMANDLVELLKRDFKWHVRKKDQINIESKLKTVRYIGEMVKFKLFPKSEALHCVKSLMMFDFTHHNIEMACALLDTCGRFLYRSQDSHHRTKIYLDVMMRKKAALHLDSRYTTMIENAFYYSNPPDVPQATRKVRPPLHEYIRKLLYKDLSKVTTEKVLRQMRKLNWDCSEIAFYATKSLIAVWNVRYNSIHCAANLLAGLAPYHEHVAIQVVDGVLEDIRLGMEINHPKYNQRRVSCVKFLGELYNYRMVESTVIFNTLYSFITFGVSFDGESVLDSPEHLFRVRLTCVVLETCGQYFDKGSSKKKLDCFLIYYQRYYWFKRQNSVWTENRPFPIDVENLMHDTMEAIRPKVVTPQNYEEASKAAEDLENEYKQKLASVLPIVETDEGNSSEADEGGLSTIQESEELDELSNSLSNADEDDSETSGDDRSQRSHTGSLSNRDQGEEGDYVEASENDDDDILDSAGEDNDDEITLVTGRPKFVKCSEDDDFMTAFDKMMSENIQARNQESLKVPQLDIAVPMHLKDKNKKAACTSLDGQEAPVEDKSIDFVLMTRKGNKQQFTNLNVPISAEFAAKYKEREHAEKMEKEKMKQVVLGIHERQEEEDYQEMIAALNRPMPLVNANRDRRLRSYQHPKGAPDAELIFGSKKR